MSTDSADPHCSAVANAVRLGIDIGGTFTDLVLLNGNGETDFAKIQSTPNAPEEAVLRGVCDLLEKSGTSPDAVTEIVHGTTVGSNALVQRAGSPTGLLTTKGFRDILEIGRLRTPEMFDLGWDKPKPLVQRRHRMEVPERIDASGSVLIPLDEQAVLEAALQLCSQGIDSLAICFINSYLNPAHERRAAEILAEHYPQLALSLSVDVLAEAQEYERSSTVAVNAYVLRILGDYLSRLESGLSRIGINARLRVANSNGGLSALRTAREKPVFFISSGRSAGVAGAGHLGVAIGRPNLIVFDMGGTTASASLIDQGQLSHLQEYEFRAGISTSSRFIKAGGFLMRVPTIDIAEIGSGAGSIARVDSAGLLQVGPVSAGADPGPACYGAGGSQATVADANLLLGYLPTHLAGGALELDHQAARQSIREAVADPLGISEVDAAQGIRTIVNSNMSRVIRAVTVERGVDPRDFSLLAFGGSGPLHACDLADEVGIREVIFAPMPGVFTAMGMLAGDIERYFIRPLPGLLEELRDLDLQEMMQLLRDEAASGLREEGVNEDQARYEYQLDLRFLGQDSKLAIVIESEMLESRSEGHSSYARVLRERFLATYQSIYRYVSSDQIEMVNLRLVMRATRQTQLEFAQLRSASTFRPNEARDETTVRDHTESEHIGSDHLTQHSREMRLPGQGTRADENTVQVSVIKRDEFTISTQGPAIIESSESTIFIAQGWHAETLGSGAIVANKLSE